MFQILVVDSEREQRELYCSLLRENGYHAIEAVDGQQALDILENTYIDLIVSDVSMTRMDGLSMTRALREADFWLPIILVTELGSSADKRDGFHAGADDYMVEPIDLNELIWRIEALLRRCRIVNQRKISMGSTELDCDTMTIRYEDSMTELPQKEFFLLYKLLSYPNRVFTRRQIMDDIWGVEIKTDTHTLDVHISRLRERFKTNPDFEIVTVRGLCYKAVKKA